LKKAAINTVSVRTKHGYPTPLVRTKALIGFQRWVVGAYDKRFTWEHWQAAAYRLEKLHLVRAVSG
jgi:hypothetical protein